MCRVLQRNRWALFILVRTIREDLLEGGLLHLRFEGSVGLLQIVKKKKKKHGRTSQMEGIRAVVYYWAAHSKKKSLGDS